MNYDDLEFIHKKLISLLKKNKIKILKIYILVHIIGMKNVIVKNLSQDCFWHQRNLILD